MQLIARNQMKQIRPFFSNKNKNNISENMVNTNVYVYMYCHPSTELTGGLEDIFVKVGGALDWKVIISTEMILE